MRRCVLTALSFFFSAPLALALDVVRVSPTGEHVAPGQQIVIEFDAPVVALGASGLTERQVDHLDLQPELDCAWRWLDRQTLACQLDGTSAIQAATTYRLRVERGFPGLDGAAVGSTHRAQFSTPKPHLRWAMFERWLAPGLPVVRLQFDQPVTKTSVEDVFRFEVAGRFFGQSAELAAWQYDGEPPHTVEDEEARRIWVAKPQKPLPEDRAVSLALKKGLRSASGPNRGEAHTADLKLHTHGTFAFLGVQCGDITVAIADEQQQPCDPDYGFELRFSSPLKVSQAASLLSIAPAVETDRWQGDWDMRQQLHTEGTTYSAHWFGRLGPDTEYVVTLPEGEAIEDLFGRTLRGPVEIRFRTGHRRPSLQLPHTEAVLEAGIDSDLPLYLVNLDSVDTEYRRVDADGVAEGLSLQIPVPQALDRDVAVPLGIRQMLPESGIVNGLINTTPVLGPPESRSRFTAQVTPYQVHFKLGHFRSLVWVTDLATGEPVPDATIHLYRGETARIQPPRGEGRTYVTDGAGVAWLPGAADIDPQLAAMGWRCDSPCRRWLVRVDGNKGMAVLPLTYDFQMSLWRASRDQLFLNQNPRHGHVRAWGTTPQGVYRPGSEVAYKFYVRGQSNQELTAPPRGAYTLKITDPTGKVVQEFTQVALNEFGAGDGRLTLATNSVMGWYNAEISAPFLPNPLHAFDFLVTEFEPSPFRVRTELPGDAFGPGARLEARTTATLHSGGAYPDAATRTVVRVRPRHIGFDHPLSREFDFNAGDLPDSIELERVDGQLDGAGTFLAAFSLDEVPEEIVAARIVVESSVQDDRGKSVAASARADYHSVREFVGLRAAGWVQQVGREAELDVLTVDTEGEPVAGVDIAVEIERLIRKAAKVRGAGNVYLTEFVESWQGVERCELRSALEPLRCPFVPPAPGEYRAIASTDDGHRADLNLWAVGDGHVVWGGEDEDGVSLMPDADRYAVGDTARILVQNPLPGALALVSIERYGVLRSHVQRLEGSTPVLELPIEAGDAPGVYVSVSIFSPRVEAPPPDNAEGGQKLDLGKPQFRLGYVALSVEDPDVQLPVSVRSDRSLYKPGERVTLSARSAPATELALVVIDEAVLDLVRGGERYFDPRDGFRGLHGVDVDNYSLLSRLVGRTLFESKDGSPGGDGGLALSVRSVIDYVAYFNPSLVTDADGKVQASFDLPDNLTGWRVIAFAADGGVRFGFAENQFRTNLQTELRPIMPNQVGEGDEFEAAFSVMNRTDSPREITVTLSADGSVAEAVSVRRVVKLEPFARTTVKLPLQAAMVSEDSSIQLSAIAHDAVSRDALTHELPVLRRRTVEVVAEHGSLSPSSPVAKVKLELPEPVHDDVGGLDVTVASTVIGQLDESFRYMRDYPYACWEQKLSKGVVAGQFNRLNVGNLSWDDSTQLPGRVLAEAPAYQAPNGGMAYFVGEDARVSPYLSAFTALLIPELEQASGEAAAPNLVAGLNGYLETLLKKDQFGSHFSLDARRSVRALAVSALARSGQSVRGEISRLLEHAADLDAFALANLLQAANALSEERLAERIRALLLARLNRSSGLVTLASPVNAPLLHGTPARDQCAVLWALTGDASLDIQLAAGLARAVQRQLPLGNTQEHLYCTTALSRYAERFEAQNGEQIVTASVEDLLRQVPLPVTVPMKSIRKDQPTNVELVHEGSGRSYYSARLTYAPLAAANQRLNAGLSVSRQYSVRREDGWVLLEDGDPLRRGDLVRIALSVNAPSEQRFVVVDDPVPGGLEPVDRHLATASSVDAEDERRSCSFYHRELGHGAARFYADRMTAGDHELVYTAQVVATGRFSAPPARVQAMYDPDVFGLSRPSTLVVEP